MGSTFRELKEKLSYCFTIMTELTTLKETISMWRHSVTKATPFDDQPPVTQKSMEEVCTKLEKIIQDVDSFNKGLIKIKSDGMTRLNEVKSNSIGHVNDQPFKITLTSLQDLSLTNVGRSIRLDSVVPGITEKDRTEADSRLTSQELLESTSIFERPQH